MKNHLTFLSIALVIFIGSCKDENPQCVAGRTGAITLALNPQHHGAPIYGATAHLKFNTQSSAGAASNYDLHATGDADKDYIHVEGLNCGSYFIYCVGYDSTYQEIVFGGIPFVIEQNQSGEIEVNLPVTEL